MGQEETKKRSYGLLTFGSRGRETFTGEVSYVSS